MYFIGIIISVLTLPRVSDLYGRKWIVLATGCMQLPVYIWLFWMSSILEVYIGFFIMGLGFGGSISINALYVQELLQKRHRATVLTIGQTIEGLTIAFLVIYLLFISKYW